MSERNQVGKALERAVRAIEKMIIQANPGLSRAPFTIQPNAILTHDGERYEIDVLVIVNADTDYKSTHFFECKNRKEPATQADVTLLADKVRTFSATRGTLVSREFSSCARAKAAKTGIDLVPFDDEIWFPLGAIFAGGVGYSFPRCQLQVHRRFLIEDVPCPDWKTVFCGHHARLTDFPTFVHELATRRLVEIKAFTRPSGLHAGRETCRFDFEAGELMLGDWDVATVSLDFDYAISLRPARLVSTFSVEKKGRFARFECAPDEVDGARLAIEITGPPATAPGRKH